MCVQALLPLLGVGGAGAATAAGAAAGAATAGAGLSLGGLGTLVSVGGALLQGVQGASAAKSQARAIEQQRKDEAQLNATEDLRGRQKFLAAISQQRAELAGRGIQLDSVTAMALGRTAAQEMSFDSQATRTSGVARDRELSAAQRASAATGLSSILKGTFSAAGSLISGAPDLWPNLDKKLKSFA
jgi:hypothetical protein